MHKHSYSHFQNGTTRIVATCLMCKQDKLFVVNTPDYLNWQRGALIQDVLTDLSPAERELLISGFCGNCFDKLVADDNVRNHIIQLRRLSARYNDVLARVAQHEEQISTQTPTTHETQT